MSTKELKGIIGGDPRLQQVPFDESVQERYCLSFYSGNLVIPRGHYGELGGFDEKIVKHGGNDAEFGMRMQLAGKPCLFSQRTIGYHIYHDRSHSAQRESVQQNVDYYESKHDFDALGIERGDMDKGEFLLKYKGVNDAEQE